MWCEPDAHLVVVECGSLEDLWRPSRELVCILAKSGMCKAQGRNDERERAEKRQSAWSER